VSLASGFTWTYQNIKLLGYSMAGITTSIAMPEADVLFDIGQGLPWQNSFTNIFLTHGHMDHASGLPYLIGQKSMHSQPTPQIHMPPVLVTPMKELMRIWEKVEDHQYKYNFIPTELGREYRAKNPYIVKAFPTFHRVPSFGYTIFERKKRLKDEYRELDRNGLIDLRRKGVELDEQIDEPLVSFTGDTKIEYLENCDWLARSKVLLTEVTYIDEAKTVENARTWGHLHFDELLKWLPKLKCEKIVLIHVSARYTTKRIREVIEERVPEQFKSRIEIFPRPT
jgi:ribonuclease Z